MNLLNWPGNSPDLNPIEDFSAIVKAEPLYSKTALQKLCLLKANYASGIMMKN